jgi:hypothetical protein
MLRIKERPALFWRLEMQKISQPLKKPAAVFAAMVLGLVSSCASKEISDYPPELPLSEAALLDDSERSTPVWDDSAVFADLHGQPADGLEDFMTTEVSFADTDSPFYNPVGGETLGRIAYTLYGDRSRASSLLQKNPELRGVKSLAAYQRVYFDFDGLRPMPTLLTKDLIDRYGNELAARIQEQDLPRETITLEPGETLQSLSQRLYGTTRYWTEIYLLNQKSISNYDQVRAGASLTVYQRGHQVAAPTPAPAPAPEPFPVMAEPVAEEPVAQPYFQDSAVDIPEASPVEAVPMDPIPETPSFSSTVSESTPEQSPATYVPQEPASGFSLGGSANVRRGIYAGLILLIGIAAFFMTRSSKKKGFDMLDVTTTDTAGARQKLGGKDNQKQDIG